MVGASHTISSILGFRGAGNANSTPARMASFYRHPTQTDTDHSQDSNRNFDRRFEMRDHYTVSGDTERQVQRPKVRRNASPRDEQSGLELQFPRFDAIYTPGKSKDITVHVSLDVTHDVDEELEKFSKLRRLGDFKEAQKLFNERLSDRFDDPYFFIQYAQLLLEAGDFRSFSTLRSSHVFGDLDHNSPQNDQELLLMNWNLLVLLAMLHTSDLAVLALREARNALSLLSSRQELRSTEVCTFSSVR